jgi:hypothetical protein
MARAHCSISPRPRGGGLIQGEHGAANGSPSPAMSASSLRNAYDKIRLSMARSLETEPWFRWSSLSVKSQCCLEGNGDRPQMPTGHQHYSPKRATSARSDDQEIIVSVGDLGEHVSGFA